MPVFSEKRGSRQIRLLPCKLSCRPGSLLSALRPAFRKERLKYPVLSAKESSKRAQKRRLLKKRKIMREEKDSKVGLLEMRESFCFQHSQHQYKGYKICKAKAELGSEEYVKIRVQNEKDQGED